VRCRASLPLRLLLEAWRAGRPVDRVRFVLESVE
jgi:hypothetical protein